MNTTENPGTELTRRILETVRKDPLNRQYLANQIGRIVEDDPERIASRLLALFVHLRFDEQEALDHWEKILEHHATLNGAVDRDVGLRVAMLDYFLNLNRMLNHPMLVEIHIFRQTEQLAMSDGLTGLFNRRYFDLNIQKELKRAQRYHKELSLLLVDLDHFKTINDTHGHQFGDEVLRRFSGLLEQACRTEDIICRYGGEEFVLLLPEISASGSLQLGERLRRQMQQDPFFKEHRITFSGGIASYPRQALTAEELIANADRALYLAKETGRNRIRQYFTEKRRWKRYQHSWELRCSLLDGTALISEPVYTQDVSAGGIRFEADKEILLDTPLLAELRPHPGDADFTGLPVKAVWIRRMGENRFAYGVEFLDLTEEQRETLQIQLPASHFYDDLP